MFILVHMGNVVKHWYILNAFCHQSPYINSKVLLAS